MKVTDIKTQVRNPNRVNISIDGTYACSLTIGQVVDEGIKVGSELDETSLKRLESESTFGKLYQRTLEYVIMRPRSEREVRDYLYRKTQSRPVRNRQTGDVKLREGVAPSVAERVFVALQEKSYVSDEKFADFWVRHRFIKKGVSQRKLRSELQAKGVSSSIIDSALHASDRDESDELDKIVEKKRHRYDDRTKFMQYLARQGFRYDDIKTALERDEGVR